MAQINHLILHEVVRKKDGGAFKKKLRETENSKDTITPDFSDSLTDLFTKTNLNIGEFGVDGDNSIQPAFEQLLLEHYTEELKCEDFVALTQKMANRFAVLIQSDKKQNVKGGVFVFSEYERANKKWLSIAILQRSGAYNADDQELELTPSEVIDIDKLHMGAAINLTDWHEKSTSRYIKFKAGLAREVRNYFESYIGCQRDKSAAKIETKVLKTAISKYSEETLSLSQEDTQKKLDLAHSFIKEKINNGEEVELSHVASHIFPETSESFLTYTITEYDLGETISIDKSVLRSYKRISGRNTDISISFNRDLLGKKIHYSNGKLVFDVIPDSLKSSIEENMD